MVTLTHSSDSDSHASPAGRRGDNESRARPEGWLFAAALISGFVHDIGLARGQTVDYFSTPWVVSPLPPATNTTSPQANPSGNRSPRTNSNLYSHALAQSEPEAPPWTVTGNVGIDEIATDNVAETEHDRIADIESLASAGATATADSTRLSGILSATGVYRRDIKDTGLDGFSGYGYANGSAAIVPGLFNFSLHGLMDDISREGEGLQNVLVQTPQETQTYSVSGFPYLTNRIGNLGSNELRYQIGQVWFVNNTGVIGTPGLNIGPITSSTDQNVREDLKMAGTMLPRLTSDVSLSGMENDSGELGSGDYTNLNGELINEYEVTRYASAIAGAGYERLHDNDFPTIDGESPVWDIGTRLRPDPDSYVLLTYGHHYLKSDFAGELEWQLSDLTNVYAAYTDSITNSQQSIIGNTEASQVGPGGADSGVSFSQSTLIGTLDDQTLSAGGAGTGSPLGVPLTDINNALPLQNGLFRDKSFRATARTLLDGDSLSLTAYYLQSTQLTAVGLSSSEVGQVDTTEAGTLIWNRPLSPDLTGQLSAGYSHLNLDNADLYNTSVGLTQVLSESLSIVLRYDLIYREAHPNAGGYLQNAVTIGLHKTFE